MKQRLGRHLAAGLATMSVLIGLCVGAVPSRAAVIGNFAFNPSYGTDTTAMALDTSGPCLNGTHFRIFLAGPGFPAVGVPVSADARIDTLTVNGSGGYVVPLADSLQNFALAQSPAATLSGSYAFSGHCTNTDGSVTHDSFRGNVDFVQNDAAAPSYAAKDEVLFGYFTATALSASPAGPVNAGVPVTFTAHVSSSPLGGAIGTVQLMDGGSAIGSPTSVDAAGSASITTSFTDAGNHSIRAAFVGKLAFITDSTSSPLTLGVNSAPADPTTTSPAISPSSATAADAVTLTASVADVPHPATRPQGTIAFMDGSRALGPVLAVSAAGTATLTRAYPAGDHSFRAVFVPTDPLLFAPSSSTSQAYTVGPAAVRQSIETTVDAGSLTISIDDTGPVVLPSPVLNATATLLTTSGLLHPVTVTDTRAGNPGWVLSGQVSDFTSTSGDLIAAVNLGWVPSLVDQSPGQAVTLGPSVSPAGPPLIADPATGARGLHLPRTLASTAGGSGTGTARLGADLSLNVPTTVPAGVYEATLTLTAI